MCLNPRHIRLANGREMVVDCGHCSQCLKQYQDQWAARLHEEVAGWKKVDQDGRLLPPVVFFTLKFRNEDIPCKYLVLTREGYYQTTVRPSCEVLEFWTDTRRETRSEWKKRRRNMLARYASVYSYLVNQEREATYLEMEAHRDRMVFQANPYAGLPHEALMRWRSMFVPDLPMDVSFYVHEGGTVEHPRYDETEFLQPLPPDQIGVSEPVLALEFHTVDKSGLQAWLKRCRRRFEYAFPDGTDRQVTTWTDSEGNVHKLPSSALTPTFKYFITSEYGPQTNRPHYHGVLFGVTYDEFAKWFAPDWMAHYGSVDFSVLRPTGGAITYLGKYCSKGSYEHPYCCRDFIYPSGKEYHSDHYVNCVDDFHLDAPMVSPTFHLISKGIGARYAFQAEILKYFGVQLADYVTTSGVLKWSCHDLPEAQHFGVRPSLELPEVFVCNQYIDYETGEVSPGVTSMSESLDVRCLEDGSIILRKLDQRGRLVGESVIQKDAVVNAVIEELTLNKKYSRTYVTSKNSASASRGTTLPRWHFIGLPGLAGVKTKKTSISLPRYYRQWLVSPLSSALRSCAAKRLHPDLDAEISRTLQRLGPEDTPGAAVLSFLAGREMVELDTSARLRLCAGRMYQPAHVHDLD